MEDKKNRLDNLVSQKFNISRTLAKEYIVSGYVFVNNKKIDKANFKTSIYDVLKLDVPIVEQKNSLPISNMPVEIVYEDDYIFIVNKPSGIIVHPTTYENNETLANRMKKVFINKKISIYGDELRNGIVHRLDKDTSGLLIVAKNQESYDAFSKMILDKKVSRKYIALMHGHLKTKKVEVQAPIARVKDSNKREVSTNFDAKDSTTIFHEIEKFKNFSLVECELITGRTHQIRVHAEFIKNNIINDPIYGVKHTNKFTKYGQYLTAYKIEFIHPFIKEKKILASIEMPKEFKEYIKNNK